MPWKCPNSGTENADDRHICMTWGYVRLSRVMLTACATGKTMTIGVDTPVGKGSMRPLGDPDYVYASDPQFHILRDPTSGEWVVVHDCTAKNPTHLNGYALSAKTPLRNGTFLTVGPARLKLAVDIQFS